MEQARSYHIHNAAHAAAVLALANDYVVDVTRLYTPNRYYTRHTAGVAQYHSGHAQTCESMRGYFARRQHWPLCFKKKTQVNGDQVYNASSS